MRTFEEICLSLGLDINRYIDFKRIIKYRGHKRGIYKDFETLAEVKKFSKNFELIPIISEEESEYFNFKRKKQSEAEIIWEEELRQEYSYLSDKVFKLAYEQALSMSKITEYFEEYNGEFVAPTDYALCVEHMVVVVNFIFKVMEALE